MLALRWRDVDFAGSAVRVRASYYAGNLTTPKSREGAGVPLAPDVASALAQLGQQRDWVGDDGLVFAGEAGGYPDGSALRRRYEAALATAGLGRLRFHDLRHRFGTRMIAKADIRRVQEWMGYADIQTTMRYLDYAPRAEDAAWSPRRSRSPSQPTTPFAPTDAHTFKTAHLRGLVPERPQTSRCAGAGTTYEEGENCGSPVTPGFYRSPGRLRTSLAQEVRGVDVCWLERLGRR